MARLAPALLPFLVLVATGLRGLDFGFHWDEPYHVDTVRSAVERGVPLPGEYRYPAVSWWLASAAALPDLARAVARAPSAADARTRLESALAGKDYLLRARAVFLLGTAATVLVTYVLVLGWRRRVGEALVAASVLGLSWEVAYHARWVAPDGIAMLFVACATLCAVAAVLRRGRRPGLWPWAGAVAAGLAFGTKWPAGLALVPVWIAAWQTAAPAPVRRRLWRCVQLGGVTAVTYLLTTPGTLLEPSALVASLERQQWIYAKGHLGHGVAPGPEHLLRVGEWLALSLASPWLPVALAFFALAVLGGAVLVRESRRLALVFLSFPALYLAFFAAYRTVIVRNYLVLAPFVAVLAARGLFWFLDRIGSRAVRGALAAAAGAALVANGVWLVRAAESIRQRRDAPLVRQLADYLAAHPDVRYAASPRVLRELRAAGFRPGRHVGLALAGADEVVVHASDAYGRIVVARPRFDWATTWFGPYEVNIDYYPNWLGADRILVLPVAHFPTRVALPPGVAPPELRPGALSEAVGPAAEEP